VNPAPFSLSAAAHRWFDPRQYPGVPRLVSTRLFGRWMPFDWQRTAFERWLRPDDEEPSSAVGGYEYARYKKLAA
jgi:hypothetical protein